MNIVAHQEQAEESLFSHLKYNMEAAGALTLDPQCFSSPFRAELFKAVQALGRQGLQFDRRLIKEQLVRKNVELHEKWWTIFDHQTNESQGDQKIIEHYGHLLRNYSVREQYQAYLEKAQLAPFDLKTDVRSLFQQHLGQIAKLQDTITMDIDPAVEAIYERGKVRNPNPYYSSGLDAIDRNVKGLRAGHMWVISGAYKSRKTTVALNIVATQLRNGKSVMYVALEDDDQAFLNKLVAIWGDIPHDEVDGIEETARVKAAREEISKTKLRIYDAKKSIHNWKILPSLIASDQMRYGSTDLVVIDYIQAYSVQYDVLQEMIPAFLRTAAERQVAMLVLSQMNNVDMRNQRFNSPSGQDGILATKGTGDLGAACHVGMEIGRDLQIPGELMLTVKVARNGQPQKTFCAINEASGYIAKNGSKADLLVRWDDNDEFE